MSYEIQRYNHDSAQWEDYQTLDYRGGLNWSIRQTEAIINRLDSDNFRLVERQQNGSEVVIQ